LEVEVRGGVVFEASTELIVEVVHVVEVVVESATLSPVTVVALEVGEVVK
jgi:hypothetical protein